MPIAPLPKLFPGRLHKDNKGAIDWSYHNLLAYACYGYVVIVDPISLSIIQTLDEHKAHISVVKWSPDYLTFSSDLETTISSPAYKLKLATGDKSGTIMIWSVLEASVITSLQDPTLKQVVDIRWLSRDPYLLVALYSNQPTANTSTVVLWNTLSGNKVWKFDINDIITNIEINPFDASHFVLASPSGNIYFVSDFNYENKPVDIELKYTISSNRNNRSNSTNISNNKDKDKDNAINNTNSDFQQLLFSPHTRNIIYFLLTKEIIIFDLTIHQAIGNIVLDRTRSPFTTILITRDNGNLIFALHEDASLSSWIRKKGNIDYKFELQCYSDNIRFNKQSKKKGFSIVSIINSPLHENNIATITNDGTIWVWQYNATNNNYTFCITGLVENISSNISSLCVCPYSSETETLIALGTYHGTVQIIDMIKSVTKSEYLLWNQPVRGVRWCSNTTLIAFNTEEISKNEFKNRLTVLDLKTGKQQEIRKVNGTESTFIRALRISSARQYFIVLLKDRPFELWDLKTFTLLRTMKPFVQITSIEWAPLKSISPFDTNSNTNSITNSIVSASSSTSNINTNLSSNSSGIISSNSGNITNNSNKDKEEETKSIREQFVFTLPDGSIRNYTVYNGVVTPAEMNADLGMGIISSLAWKDDILVSGDTVGAIHVWNLTTKKSQVYTTNKGLIRRIRFSPSTNSHIIIVLFNEGDFGIWDLDHGVRLSISNYLRGRDLKAIDCDWIAENTPIVATTDGCVRILDRSLSISNSPFVVSSLSKPLTSPYLLPQFQAVTVKIALQHLLSFSVTNNNNNFKFLYDDEKTQDTNVITTKRIEAVLLEYVDNSLLNEIISTSDLAEKCLLTAKYYGNQDEIQLWTLAIWSFKKYKLIGIPSNQKPYENKSEENTTQELPNSGTTIQVNNNNNNNNNSSIAELSALPLHFDLLLENHVIRSLELQRAQIQESKKSGYDLTKKIAEFNLLLGQKDKTIELLMETPHDNNNFYRDALKAAVVAASVSPESFKNTIKLISTNMIANGNIDEGVQLLCLVGKSLDACKYLQSYDRYTDAAWLAKISLSESESADIMRRWANFLNVTNQKMKAVNILITLGEYQQVLQLLFESKNFDTAALFATAALQNGLLITNPNTESLLQSIYLEYGFFLYRIGNNSGAEFYWQKAGEQGEQMIIQANNVKDRKAGSLSISEFRTKN